MHRRVREFFRLICLALCATGSAQAADHVDITWLSIANIHFEVGKQRILADGYITRLPNAAFFGGQSGFGQTQRALRPDEPAVREVLQALGGRPAVNLLLTGHNHFDHSFDTATWSKLTGARVIGAKTACLQTRAQGIPAKRCTTVYGGENYELEPGLHVYVIRWNHSGGPALNPELHAPLELDAIPTPDAHGALRAGVTEDFPNGGGNRAYLFKLDGPQGPLSWLFQDSGSAIDLASPVIVAGKDYGAPLDNLRAALRAANLESVDLWIATGGADVARLVLPVLKPAAYLPVHWDGLFGAFKAGPAQPYSDPDLARLLAETGVNLITPAQYMDKWRLDKTGVHPLDNSAVKRKLGFH